MPSLEVIESSLQRGDSDASWVLNSLDAEETAETKTGAEPSMWESYVSSDAQTSKMCARSLTDCEGFPLILFGTVSFECSFLEQVVCWVILEPSCFVVDVM